MDLFIDFFSGPGNFLATPTLLLPFSKGFVQCKTTTKIGFNFFQALDAKANFNEMNKFDTVMTPIFIFSERARNKRQEKRVKWVNGKLQRGQCCFLDFGGEYGHSLKYTIRL